VLKCLVTKSGDFQKIISQEFCFLERMSSALIGLDRKSCNFSAIGRGTDIVQRIRPCGAFIFHIFIKSQ